jgi:hypothetical protein
MPELPYLKKIRFAEGKCGQQLNNKFSALFA